MLEAFLPSSWVADSLVAVPRLGAVGALGNACEIAPLATVCLHRKQPQMQILPTPLVRQLGPFSHLPG